MSIGRQMSALHTSPKFTGFFRRLVEEEHVSATTMQTALDAAKRAKRDTVAYLIEEVHISPSLLAETISAEFAEPYFDLDVYDTSQIPKDLVDQKTDFKTSNFATYSKRPNFICCDQQSK